MKISSPKAVFANNYLYNKNRLINNHINSTYSTQINKYNDKDRFELQRIIPYKNNISFGSMITPEQEKYCKMIVHGAAAACGSISAAAGKATVVGADAWALRGTQFLMFAYMANYLKIPFMASSPTCCNRIFARIIYRLRRFKKNYSISKHCIRSCKWWYIYSCFRKCCKGY